MLIHVIEPLAITQAKIDEIKNLFIEKGHQIKFYTDRDTDPLVIIERSTGADVVVLGNLPFPALCVDALPDLKMLAVAFTGVDHVAIQACKKNGVAVCNASGYSTINVAELTIGLIIDVLRNVTLLDPVTRGGGTKDGFVGFDLSGKTVGIIGLGAIGLQVAKILKAFDCKLLGYNKDRRPLEKELGIEYTTMENLLKNSDIVTLHCPLNESTRGFIGAKELAMMKTDSYIINCARGPIIDSDALVHSLKNHEIAGAGLDVFDTEPPLSTETPILSLDNVVVTPHIAFATREAFIRRADIVSDNILSWIAGEAINIIV